MLFAPAVLTEVARLLKLAPDGPDGLRVASLPIDLWIHGHTHHSVRYELKGPRGPVRVLSNQRGYPGEKTVFDPALVVEL